MGGLGDFREVAAISRADLPDGVSRETERRLRDFVELLLRWSDTVNLVARTDREAIWNRHVTDSLQVLPFLAGREPPFIDLGSGAGFPGLVLAIASGHPFHLVEADQRKAAFLREAGRATGATVSVHATRIEAIRLPPASAVTARGLAPLPKLLGLAHPFLRPDGILLALKGKTALQELTVARAEWHMRVVVTPSRTDSTASVLCISDLRRAG